jgi:hypothetical protein
MFKSISFNTSLSLAKPLDQLDITSDAYFVLMFLQEALLPLVFNDFVAA